MVVELQAGALTMGLAAMVEPAAAFPELMVLPVAEGDITAMVEHNIPVAPEVVADNPVVISMAGAATDIVVLLLQEIHQLMQVDPVPVEDAVPQQAVPVGAAAVTTAAAAVAPILQAAAVAPHTLAALLMVSQLPEISQFRIQTDKQWLEKWDTAAQVLLIKERLWME